MIHETIDLYVLHKILENFHMFFLTLLTGAVISSDCVSADVLTPAIVRCALVFVWNKNKNVAGSTKKTDSECEKQTTWITQKKLRRQKLKKSMKHKMKLLMIFLNHTTIKFLGATIPQKLMFSRFRDENLKKSAKKSLKTDSEHASTTKRQKKFYRMKRNRQFCRFHLVENCN
jgi:hypothetical protein